MAEILTTEIRAPLTQEHIDAMLYVLRGSPSEDTLRLYIQVLMADWKRLHALHTLPPADQQRVAEIRERLASCPLVEWYPWAVIAYLLGVLERWEG